MSIQAEAKQLKNKINLIKQAHSKHHLDVFNTIRLDIQDNQLTLTGISEYAWLKINIPLQEPTNINRTVLVNTEKLTNLINLTHGETISLDITEKELIIQSSNIKHTLRLIINKELEASMVLPDINTKHIVKVDNAKLNNAIKLARTAVADFRVAYNKPELMNVNCQISNKTLSVMATDRYRLSSTVLDTDLDIAEEVSYILSESPLPLIKNCFTEEFITLNFGEDHLLIQSDDTTFLVNYVSAKFPSISQIIPKEFQTVFRFNNKELLNALKSVTYIAKEDNANNKVEITFEPDQNRIKATVQSKTGAISESIIDIQHIEGDTTSWKQLFNCSYIIDYLNNITAQSSLWQANRNKPVLIQAEGVDSLYLVSSIVS